MTRAPDRDGRQGEGTQAGSGPREDAAKDKEEAGPQGLDRDQGHLRQDQGRDQGHPRRARRQVTKQFDDGEKKAKDAFTAKHNADMEKYKDERYSGAPGWAQWTDDVFTGLPAEANQIFDRAKKVYESKMADVICKIADTRRPELDRPRPG